MPPWLVGLCFLIAVVTALAIMAAVVWRGSQPSDFFREAVANKYTVSLPVADINAFYDLKDKLQQQHGFPDDPAPAGPPGVVAVAADPWVRKLPPEEQNALRHALMKRLVNNLDALSQVQRDKPGNWKLWRGKLVSEQFWGSLVDAERQVSEEVDTCLLEAEELQAGWKDHILNQAIQIWRLQQRKKDEEEEVKKAVKQEKKNKEKEQKQKETEERMAQEEKQRQEKQAAKAMEQLLREEEQTKAKGKAKVSVAKPRPKKK
mmetsp:Transcript_65212/g.155739  ORF Transcript_65212/g.155739 Transcript_65212/m.155739 type:complete len:261 (-) Transcript_65212:46-828(-)